jgi:predicted O-methyltransferase YrrM
MDRTVYVCDSFCGFPKDEPETHWTTYKCLSVSHEEVVRNFERFGLMENVKCVPGYFSDSLKGVDGPLSVLRIDADSHRSTLTCLESLWPRLSVGGYVICDDYKVCAGARAAFIEYFKGEPEHTDVDLSAIWFQKK